MTTPARRGKGPSRPLRRAVEALLWALAAVLLGWCVLAYVEARLYQAREDRIIDEATRAQPAPEPAEVEEPTEEAAPAEASVPKTSPASDASTFGRWPRPVDVDPGLIGRIEIPRLGVRAVVREGIDSKTLRLAVGHVPGTALPSQTGNVCLAGHRDTFFRKLANVKRNDSIRVTTLYGAYLYRVESIAIASPDALRFLAATPAPTLTLVTCYPFNFIGSAPKRFIVTARRTES